MKERGCRGGEKGGGNQKKSTCTMAIGWYFFGRRQIVPTWLVGTGRGTLGGSRRLQKMQRIVAGGGRQGSTQLITSWGHQVEIPEVSQWGGKNRGGKKGGKVGSREKAKKAQAKPSQLVTTKKSTSEGREDTERQGPSKRKNPIPLIL